MVPLPKGMTPFFYQRWPVGDEIHMRRFLAVMLILFGIGLLAYPAVRGTIMTIANGSCWPSGQSGRKGDTGPGGRRRAWQGGDTGPDLGREVYSG